MTQARACPNSVRGPHPSYATFEGEWEEGRKEKASRAMGKWAVGEGAGDRRAVGWGGHGSEYFAKLAFSVCELGLDLLAIVNDG